MPSSSSNTADARQPRILFHRHTPWQSEIRCSTNILANRFQRDGYRIAYMQGIVHGGNVVARRGQWRSWQAGPRQVGGALVFTPFALLPYSRVWPLSTQASAYRSFRSCVPSIRYTLERAGFATPDVIWTANPGSGVLKELFPDARVIFQVVDYYPAFAGNEIHDIEREDYRRADHIAVIGEALKRHVMDCGVDESRISVLGQGVDHERFQAAIERPADMGPHGAPVAVWVGVLSKGDAALFEAAAEALALQGGRLLLIGPSTPWAEALAAANDNVLLLGSRSPADVSSYLAHSDIGLMLYDRTRADIYKGQNPLKLYEYAAAGLGILSTPHEEYRYLDVPADVVSTPDEVRRGVTRILADAEGYRSRSLSFAANRSWDAVFNVARRAVEHVLDDVRESPGPVDHANALS